MFKFRQELALIRDILNDSKCFNKKAIEEKITMGILGHRKLVSIQIKQS